jgi:hypothetical protein
MLSIRLYTEENLTRSYSIPNFCVQSPWDASGKCFLLVSQSEVRELTILRETPFRRQAAGGRLSGAIATSTDTARPARTTHSVRRAVVRCA